MKVLLTSVDTAFKADDHINGVDDLSAGRWAPCARTEPVDERTGIDAL